MNANSFSVSPDEKQIAGVTFENEQYAVWMMPLGDGSPAQIVNSVDEIKNTIWHADGKRVLYSANVGGIFQIFAAEASGGGNKPMQITFGERDSFALDVSGDGAKILYGSSKEESDVWGADVERGEEFSFASDISSELWANVSPDGKSVAFQSIKNLSQGDKISSGAILTKRVDSGAETFQIVANGFLPAWSLDGKRLAFMRVAGETFNLWTIRAAGGEEKQLTSGGLPSVEYTVLPYNRTQVSSFSWSPDGGKIAYLSDDDGRFNVWLVNADDASRARLSGNTDANLLLYCPLKRRKIKRLKNQLSN